MKLIIKNGKKIGGRYIPSKENVPEENLYDKNRRKLDGEYKRVAMFLKKMYMTD